MTHPVFETIALALGCLAAALGCVGLLRARGAMARLHFVALPALVAPLGFVAATVVESGGSSTSVKAVLIWVVLVLEAPLVAHVTGRAIDRRHHGSPDGGSAG